MLWKRATTLLLNRERMKEWKRKVRVGEHVSWRWRAHGFWVAFCSGLWRALQSFWPLRVRVWCLFTVIKENNVVASFSNLTLHCILFTQLYQLWNLITSFCFCLGINAAFAALGCCSLLPLLSLSVIDSHLSLSIINPPPSAQPRACARWALNWCSALRYQMARQMTSPWPHYTRTQRRGVVLTEQRADPTRTTSQHANPWNSQTKTVLKSLAFIDTPAD